MLIQETIFLLSGDINIFIDQVGVICNNARIVEGVLQGQPTEGALLACAMKVCLFHRNMYLLYIYMFIYLFISS